jgi:glucose-6-phosphate 1-dehydrogenase
MPTSSSHFQSRYAQADKQGPLQTRAPIAPVAGVDLGVTSTRATDAPTVFVIFGITGDLAQRKLLPALLTLYTHKMLPHKFAVIGCARRELSREDFRDYIRRHMNIKPGQFREEDVKHFIDHLSYHSGLFDDASTYAALAERLKDIDTRFHTCTNKLFHLSVSPALYEGILTNLASSGLTIPCGGAEGWTRVLIEKPFGNNIHTAAALDQKLGELFAEEQIFRIDHYLAKEALQNILAFRFGNALFEPLWNRHHIEKVHIKLFEKIGIEGRGEFYDSTGALRDVGQNHVLQMLALVAMDEPASFSANDIRRERAKVFKKLHPFGASDMAERAVRAQYTGYRQEKGVSPSSDTETYFRLEAHIENDRWKGVPFYLESGKCLGDSKTEIDMYVKAHDTASAARPNKVTFRVQPDECIKVGFWVKTPGFGLKVEPKTLKFSYADVPSFGALPDAYVRVIYDAIIGDQTLFTSTEEVLAAWKFITPIAEIFGTVPLHHYKVGSMPEV